MTDKTESDAYEPTVQFTQVGSKIKNVGDGPILLTDMGPPCAHRSVVHNAGRWCMYGDLVDEENNKTIQCTT